MNRALADIAAEAPGPGGPPGVRRVPNFPVAGRAHKGRRPDFTTAKHPRDAGPMFERLVDRVRGEAAGHAVTSGVFGAHMHVELGNDGPVTIWLDSNA